MDLRDYLRAIRRGWPIVVGLLVLGVLGGTALALTTAKTYKATAVIFVGTSSDTTNGLQNGDNFVQNRVSSYTKFAAVPAVTGAVIKDLGLKITRGQLAGKISASVPQGTVLINISVTDGNPESAARIANSAAENFDTYVAATDRTTNGQPVVVLKTINPANPPASPDSPNVKLDILLGVVLGLVVGVGIVSVRDALDNSVKDAAAVGEFGLSLLATVPIDKKTVGAPLAFRSDPHGARAESYRQLRTNLQFIGIDDAPRVIAVTSAVAQEGKSTVALNIAAALAEAGNKVCLIETDLRRPSLAKTLGLVGDVGLTTVLIGNIALRDALQNAGRNLAVLTAGPTPPNPSELLLTESARQAIREAAALADYTIIDTAPLLPVTDGAEAATLAEVAILVVRAGKTTRDQLGRSVMSLDRVGRAPVGVVLNMASAKSGYDHDTNYYYADQPERLRARHERNDRFVDLAYGNEVGRGTSPNGAGGQAAAGTNGHAPPPIGATGAVPAGVGTPAAAAFPSAGAASDAAGGPPPGPPADWSRGTAPGDGDAAADPAGGAHRGGGASGGLRGVINRLSSDDNSH